ncbi:MAG TPA: hypothetical protein VGN97_10185 [Mesorhizobium sp.]|jgi:hypothetical protein|nr:hypothetical protein [Mesorhizobium sp.]
MSAPDAELTRHTRAELVRLIIKAVEMTLAGSMPPAIGPRVNRLALAAQICFHHGELSRTRGYIRELRLLLRCSRQ